MSIDRKKRCDFFYFISKKFKFRSRAAFKLIEIDNKFHFFRKSLGILDLCSAPGSWMQVSRKLTQPHIPVIGVDLCKIKKIHGCVFVNGDITSYYCFNSVLRIIKNFGLTLNIILHDGSPRAETKWLSDVYKQNKLVLYAFKFTHKMLYSNGWFVTKVFKSKYFNELLFFLKGYFSKIFILKPIASRKESVEMYIICKKFSFDKKNFNSNVKSNCIFRSFGKFNCLKREISNGIRKPGNLLVFCLKLDFIKEEINCLFGTTFYSFFNFKLKIKKTYPGKTFYFSNWIKKVFISKKINKF
nr:SAM-dependent methyltransferase [Cryptomonas paramecium]